MNKKLVLIFMFVNIGICKINNWEILTHRGGYFRKLKETNFVITVFLNKEDDSIMKNLKQLENLDLIKENQIDLLIIYYNDINFFKEHYSLIENTNYMKLYLRGKSYNLENFDEKIKNNFISHFIEFLKEKFNLITKKLNDFSELQDNLKSKKILGLYLGEENYNYQNFIHLAVSNIHFDFYHSFENNLKFKVLEKFGKRIKKMDDDLFFILRDISLINNFDENEINIFDFKNNSTKNLLEFFDFEQHPKLRKCKYTILNIKNLFLKKQKMLIYFRYPDEKIDFKNDRYYAIINNIAKKMIFSECYLDDKENINKFREYFIRGNLQIKPETIYVIYVTLNNKLKIEKIDKGFELEQIGELFENGIDSKFQIDNLNSNYGDL